MIERVAEEVVHTNRWVTVCFDHVRFPDGSTGRYVRVTPTNTVTGVVVLPVRRTGDRVDVGLVDTYRYPVGRVCLEAVRGFGETGDDGDARRELAEELGVTGDIVPLGVVDPDTGMVETQVRLYGCTVTGTTVPSGDPSEATTARWLPVTDVWVAVTDGQITCSLTLAVLLRAQLAGLIPALAVPAGSGHGTISQGAAGQGTVGGQHTESTAPTVTS